MNQPKLYVPQEFYGVTKWGKVKIFHNALEVAKARLFLISCSFLLVFLVITGRLVDVCLLRGANEGSLTFATHGPNFRADIVDRNGVVLATSLMTSSLYANASVVIDPEMAAKKLTEVLPELKPADVLQRLQSGKVFVWLARHLTPQKQAEIIRLGIPGLYFQKDQRRVYPHGELFAHVLGYTDIDNHGLAGVERKFNEALASSKEPLRLSLDMRVQHVLKDELLAGISKYQAQGAAGLIMNVQTGEIVALVSLPDFDPNQVGKMGSREALFNKLTLGAYEMGSSFKIFNTALYLESGISDISTKFDVSNPIRVGRFKITDFHPHHFPLTVAEIFTESSNIGAAKMALQMGPTLQKGFFQKLGFFKTPSLEIPEIGSPLYPKQWTQATTITTSYGYGISISPLQLATGFGGVINKGIMQMPTLIKVNSAQSLSGQRILSEKTSEMMRKLMYMIVSFGRGKKAQVEGYRVGGKTGTANTLDTSGRYKKGANLTSFMGGFPMDCPRYSILIMVDRPQAIKETYGFNAAGWNAAPIAGKVIRRIAPLLQVMPVSEKCNPAESNSLMIPVGMTLGKGH